MNYGDFTALFADARGDWAYVADIDTHEILFMSHAAMEMIGLKSEEDYRSRKCYQVLQGLDAPCPFCSLSPATDRQSRCVWKQYNPIVQKWLRLEEYLFQLDGRRCRGEWGVDISQDHNMISDLQDQVELGSVLLKSVRTLALEPDINVAVNLFLQYIGGYYQARRVCIFELDRTGQWISCTYEWCMERSASWKQEFSDVPVSRMMDWLTAPVEDAPRPDQWELGSITAMLDVLSLRSAGDVMVMPLRREGTLMGFMLVDHAGSFPDDPSLLRLSAGFITEEFQKRQLVLDMSRQDLSDRLTGLPNRKKYLQTLSDCRKAPPDSLAVFHLDLNGLKLLNDQAGHEAGDQLICRCADILRSLDLNAYRVDGDEFIILQPGVGEAEAQQLELSLRMALAALKPHSISVGRAWGAGELDIAALTSDAYFCMCAEKQLYYRTRLPESQAFLTGDAADVLQDIRDRRFVVYFQPQVDLDTGRIYGAEALVRKLDDQGNIIPPVSFIPLYESRHVISHLDFHVLEQVCRFLREWALKLDCRPKISVNFSRLTLMEPDVVSRVLRICADYGVSPGQLNIEVTESTGRLDQDRLGSLVLGLREAGFLVSLDDFGSKYSNLSILTNIDFHLIKMDKSLIDRISSDERSSTLVKSLVSLCEDVLSTQVLAEGVETRQQVELLKNFSCDYVQGYYFSRPVPAAEFSAMLEEDRTFPL